MRIRLSLTLDIDKAQAPEPEQPIRGDTFSTTERSDQSIGFKAPEYDE
jgi:hypothetical protein